MTSDDSNRSIASQFGMTEGAIRKRAKAEGWKKSAELSTHVDNKVRVALEADKLSKIDAILPPVVRHEINMRVTSRVEAIQKFSRIQTNILEDILSLWEIDKQIKPDPLYGYDNAIYGKAKIVNEIANLAKKNLLGDAPLIPDGDGSDDEDWGIVIPHQEAVRLAEVEERLNKKEDDE